MKKAFQKAGVSLFVLLTSLVLLAQPVFAQGPQAWKGRCVEVLETTSDGSINNNDAQEQLQGVATIYGLECLIANFLSVAVTFIGLAGFVMMLYGGFRYMLSGGQSKGIEDAQKTITMALVGLIVALSAYFILNLVTTFTGVSILTTFGLPSF